MLQNEPTSSDTLRQTELSAWYRCWPRGRGYLSPAGGSAGAGRIGRETARLAEAFGARCTLSTRNEPLAELLPLADIVSLHCPLTERTHHMIDRETLRQMKGSAVLVNTARGPVVNEHALANALREGMIGGAAFDVYEFEPIVVDELLNLDNVVLSPHLGSATHTTREARGVLAVDALRAVLLENRRPENAVA